MSLIQSNVTSLTVASSTTLTAGQVTVVSNTGETISKYDPDPGNTQIYKASGALSGGFGAWNSGTYAPDLGGAYGSLIWRGGGDGDYWGTEFFAFDIANGTWSRLDEPTTAMNGLGYKFDPGFDLTYCEHVHNADNTVNDSTRYPNCGGTPAVAHTYDYILCTKGSATYPNGRVIIPLRFALYNQGSCLHAHHYDLATRQWSRMTSAIPNISLSTGGSCLDTLRNRVWWCTGTGNGGVGYLDVSTTANPATAQNFVGGVFLPQQPVMIYHPGFDAILISGGDYNTGAWSLYYMNPNAPASAWTKLTVTGTTPVVNEYAGLGFCHVYEPTLTDVETGRSWDSMFMYQEGAHDPNLVVNYDTQRIYKLIAPAGSVTGTWTCEAITMGGTTVTGGPSDYSRGMYKRLTYVSKAKAIMWYSSASGQVFAYKPAGL